MTDLITSATTELPWTRALRIGLTRHGRTPIYDQLLAEHQAEQQAKTPLSSRRRTDAGTPRAVKRPRKAATSAQRGTSTRTTKTAAGQGNR